MTGDTGKIRYPARSSQPIDFSGIRHGNATPSNVDGLLELDGKLFVILEYKHSSAQEMPRGQRLMIERLTDQLGSGICYSLAVVGVHNAEIGEEIDAANAMASEVRWRGQWRDLKGRKFTVKQCVDHAYNFVFHEPF